MNQIKEMCAIVSIKDATPLAYINVYDQGDLWLKVRGCSECSLTRRKRCCGNCPSLTHEGDCNWQKYDKVSRKPFYCVVLPTPERCSPDCALVFSCVKGKMKGAVRRVTDMREVFR
jgi:hypothetical protein